MSYPIFYRRALPHYQPKYATYFTTFRLAGSLPLKVIKDYIDEQKAELTRLNKIKNNAVKKNKEYNLHKKYFDKFDILLGNFSNENNWLQNTSVANIVSKSIKHFDNNGIDLIAYCIMPNHVHIVFRVGNDNSSNKVISGFYVTKIMQSLKKYTAIRANKVLVRTGQFWHRESYDHIIRNERELRNAIFYLLENPVKARLVDSWEKWKWNYLKQEYRESLIRNETEFRNTKNKIYEKIQIRLLNNIICYFPGNNFYHLSGDELEALI